MEAPSLQGLTMAQRLVLLREEQDLVQSELSRLAGVALSTISLIERGVTTKPMRGTLERLVEALGCDLTDLTGGERR